MDAKHTGALIRQLRGERGLTQKELARSLCVSDKAVSKWECGQGCPDVSLLPVLAAELRCDVETIIAGSMAPNDPNGGHMRRLRFYVCPTCGNVLTAMGSADVSCCGRSLEPREAQPADDDHRVTVVPVEDESYITFDHPMEKDHFISFIAAVSFDRMTLVRLYPEQGGEARLPLSRSATLYTFCTGHGLMSHEI